MIVCIIFDLDGTLFDSTNANVSSYQRAFADAGVAFDESAYRQQFGLRFEEMMQQLAPQTSPAKRAQIKKAKAGYYQKSLALVKPNHGLLALLKSCRPKYQTALVTTAAQENVFNLLNYFKIDQSLFDCIITAQDVKKSKPHPECYQQAMEKLGVKPAQCIVFEDTDIGVAAAKKAGAQVIKVRL